MIYRDGSTLKELYRFGPSTLEVIPYSCGVLALGIGYNLREFNPRLRGLLLAYMECTRSECHNGLV